MDIGSVCLMGIIAIASFALASRRMGRAGGRTYPRPGDGASTGGGRSGVNDGPPGRQGGPLFPPQGSQGGGRSSGMSSDFGQSERGERGDSPPGRRGGSLFPTQRGNGKRKK